jgi:hypothetical protein
MHQHFRRERQYDHRRYRERAEGAGATIDHHGDQHHRPTVNAGISASSARTAKNTTPAPTAMRYPDTGNFWNL